MLLTIFWGFVMPLPIETERLIVRRFGPDDFEDRLAYLSDPEVAQYEYWSPYTAKGLETEIHGQEAETQLFAEGRWRELAVELKAERKVIGNVSLKVLSRQHRMAEAGWVLNRCYQGQGFATEAGNAVLDLAFSDLDLYWVVAFCDVRNAPSYRLMERLGMRRQACHRRSKFAKGEWRDEYVYSIVAPEWQGG